MLVRVEDGYMPQIFEIDVKEIREIVPRLYTLAMRRVCREISAGHWTASCAYGKALVEHIRIGEKLF